MDHAPGGSADQSRNGDEPAPVESTLAADTDVAAPPVGGDAIDAIARYGPPRAGEVFFGRYLVEKKIGEGGMGTVWLVRHLELDAPRAVKLIVSGSAFDPQMRARFQREARAMARLSHPNAVTVHDARIGRDSAFIEMEFIRGQSLNQVLRPGVPMPLDWIARLLEQLCDVLQEAHRHQIVHRDLKPSNLMLVADRPPGKELLKVLDFGIAKILGAETEAGEVRTGTGCFLGSAPWTSPEQAMGEEIDPRSDLYSVGIILYEMVTGSRPFHGQLVRLVYDHVNTPPPRFSTTNPNLAVPPAVEQVVLRCLAKKPGDRPQTARDLAAEFLWAITDQKGTSSLAKASPPPVDPAQTLGDFELAPRDTSLDRSLFRNALAPTVPPGTIGLAATQPATELAAAQGRQDTWPATIAAPPSPAAVATESQESDSTAATATVETAVPTRPRLLGILLLLAVLAVSGVFFWLASTPANPLPEGYVAEGRGEGDSRPKALIRSRDKTRFIRIPGGPFQMGNDFDRSRTPADDDQPAHPVMLSDYYLQETEVTNGEMDAYFRAHKIDRDARPRRFQEAWDRIESKARRDPLPFPAVGISHALAEEYARWVGGKLPTEAQWECAARSRGKPNRYVWESTETANPRFANVNTLGENIYLPTSEVRAYPKDRTEQGIYDLTGNVREWCRDRWAGYTASQEPLRDPEGPDPANAGPRDFVIRGGSFATWSDHCRTTWPRRAESDSLTAEQLAQDGTADDLGFRVVIEWPRNR